MPTGDAAWRRAPAVTAVVVLAVAACSGGGGGARSKAQAANVRSTDLSPGWTSSPRPDPVGDEGDASRFAECLGRPDPKQGRSAAAASPNFVLQDRSQVHTSAQVVRSAKAASEDMAILSGDRALGCLRQRLSTDLQRDPSSAKKVLTITVERRPAPGVGQQAAAFRATVSEKTAAAAGPAAPAPAAPPPAPARAPAPAKATTTTTTAVTTTTTTRYVDVVLVSKGDVEIWSTFADQPGPFPDDLEQTLLTRIVGRA